MRKLFVLLGIVFTSFLTAFYLFRFSLPDSHIVQCHWKSGGSSPVGDVLLFKNSSVKINAGYIYRNGTAFAQITERKFRFLADDYIVVKNINNGISGAYYEKGCE